MTQYLVTRGRDNVDRVHRTTCAKAAAQDAKLRNLSDLGGRKLATCCKPKAPDVEADRTRAAAGKGTKVAAKRATAARQDAAVARARKASGAPAKKATTRRGAKGATVTSIDKARSRQKPTPKVDPVVETPAWDPHPTRRADLALAEGKKLKKAKADGKPIPATPNLDKVNEEYAAGVRAADRKRMAQEYEAANRPASGGRGPKATVTFTKDGKAVGTSQQRLSSMAYWYTKGIDGDSPRVSVARFREVLAELGVTDPETTTWAVTLPNGIKIGAVR